MDTKPYKRNKPNRTQPRYFNTCDVGRIAQNCVADLGVDPEDVLICVAISLGIEKVYIKQVDFLRAFVGTVTVPVLRQGLQILYRLLAGNVFFAPYREFLADADKLLSGVTGNVVNAKEYAKVKVRKRAKDDRSKEGCDCKFNVE